MKILKCLTLVTGIVLALAAIGSAAGTLTTSNSRCATEDGSRREYWARSQERQAGHGHCDWRGLRELHQPLCDSGRGRFGHTCTRATVVSSNRGVRIRPHRSRRERAVGGGRPWADAALRERGTRVCGQRRCVPVTTKANFEVAVSYTTTGRDAHVLAWLGLRGRQPRALRAARPREPARAVIPTHSGVIERARQGRRGSWQGWRGAWQLRREGELEEVVEGARTRGAELALGPDLSRVQSRDSALLRPADWRRTQISPPSSNRSPGRRRHEGFCR